MTYGVTPQGFVIKPLDVIKSGIEADEKGGISQSVNVKSRSVLGQLNGIFADRLRELWELGQAVYKAGDPDAAEDFSLDNVASFTGTLRLPATYSVVDCIMSLNASVTVPAGSVITVLGNPTARFELIGQVVGSIFTPGPVVSTTATNYVGRFRALVKGPVAADANTLTVISTSVTGWNSVTNPNDAILGRNVETNSALRTRREQNLTAVGNSTFDAMRADVANADTVNIKQVDAFENTTMATDGNGLPPKSFEILVNDGSPPAVANTVIAQAIWNSKPVGMEPYGSVSANALDSKGVVHVMKFSRPTLKPVYFEIDIEVNGLTFPIDGDAQIKNKLAATHYDMGDDVVLSALYPAVFAVSGVKRIAAFRAGFSPAPVGTVDLVIAARELATISTVNILITHV